MGVFVAATLGRKMDTFQAANGVRHSRGDGPSSLGMAIHLCDDDGSKVSALFESATLRLRGLTWKRQYRRPSERR